MSRTQTARHNSITELNQALGRAGLVGFKDCQIKVKIIDVKLAYGRVRYLIEPLAGIGQTWIEDTSIAIDRNDRMLSA